MDSNCRCGICLAAVRRDAEATRLPHVASVGSIADARTQPHKTAPAATKGTCVHKAGIDEQVPVCLSSGAEDSDVEKACRL